MGRIIYKDQNNHWNSVNADSISLFLANIAHVNTFTKAVFVNVNIDVLSLTYDECLFIGCNFSGEATPQLCLRGRLESCSFGLVSTKDGELRVSRISDKINIKDRIVTTEHDIPAYKILQDRDDELYVVKGVILRGSKVICAYNSDGGKLRADNFYVEEIYHYQDNWDWEAVEEVEQLCIGDGENLTYNVDRIIIPQKGLDGNPFTCCASGIHFFISKEELAEFFNSQMASSDYEKEITEDNLPF